ncbi:Thiosulfate:glutathione sulfurtransferase [Cichlidogyrus casuarinus]|uniref:Thiosulfate:glutathione sulfurtransferase n=1 Tax=Cichlidogyrus casuarinus TaxID=1844966 RepID=A0ABD2Q1Z9_9PLAT
MALDLLSFVSFVLLILNFPKYGKIEQITVQQLIILSEKGTNLNLIDVRNPNELAMSGKIKNAVNIPLADIVSAFLLDNETFKNKYGIEKPGKYANNVVFYCKSGGRSMKAIYSLLDMGYEHLINLKGGYDAWTLST